MAARAVPGYRLVIAAHYLPGGELAEELRAAPGWPARVRVLGVHLARLRATPVLVLLVLALGLILDHAMPADARDRVIQANSTNVANLERHHIWTLLTSAVLLDDHVAVVPLVQLFVILAAAELLWGWRRLVVVFFAGNVVASCLVYAMLRAGVRNNWFPGAIVIAPDVGTSYGLHAVSGAVAMSLPVRTRRFLVPLALLAVLVPLLGERTFTDVGHLLSTLIGFLAGYQLRRRPLAWRPRLPGADRDDAVIVRVFPSVAAAEAALTAVLHLQEHHWVRLDDAAIAWADERVDVRKARALDGAIGGACWGVVVGTLVGLPLAGLVVGAAVTALVAHLHGPGLSEAVVRRAAREAEPGQVVLLLLARPADHPVLRAALAT